MKKRKFFSVRSLKTKFIVISLLLLAIPSLVIGLAGYYLSQNELDEAGKVQLQNNVKWVLNSIELIDDEVKKGNITQEDAEEKIKQIFLGPMDEEGKRPINKDIQLGENGYIFVYDEKGVEVAHPTLEGQDVYDLPDKNGYFFAHDIIKRAMNGGGYTYYDWSLPNDEDTIVPKVTYAEQDPNWGWIVVAGTYMLDFNKGANQVLYTLLITLGSALLIGSIVIWFFTKHITDPIISMTEQVKRVANGDLTVRNINVKSKDEIGQLAQGFNLMTTNIKELIHEVNSNTEQVSSSAEKLTASAEQNSRAIEQISTTIQEVAIGAENQVNSVEESSKIIEEMALGANQIATYAEQVTETSVQASDKSLEGNQAIKKAFDQMNSINQTVGGLAESIKGLDKRSKEIGEIIKVITGIAEQTNLLALNAAIEAARAGEHGTGFAVVADEVRKLAEQSGESAKQISQLISLTQEETKTTVTSMESATIEVAEGIDVVNVAGETFEQIKRSINEVTKQIEEVSLRAQQMSSDTEKVVQSIKVIEGVAVESASGTQNISAAAEEQLASMEEITSSADSLSSMAEDLKSLISKFKI